MLPLIQFSTEHDIFLDDVTWRQIFELYCRDYAKESTLIPVETFFSEWLAQSKKTGQVILPHIANKVLNTLLSTITKAAIRSNQHEMAIQGKK